MICLYIPDTEAADNGGKAEGVMIEGEATADSEDLR